MFERIIRFAIEQRWLVLLAVLGMAARRLQLPEAAHRRRARHHQRQVQINTQAPGYSPLETEQRVTYPIETVMAGLPSLEQTRSLSRYGLSQVTVIFKDGTDIYFARQLVNERIQRRGPLPASRLLGPISTGLGEIYLWTVEPSRREKPDGSPTRPPTCARSRTGSSSRSCATCRRDRDQHHRRLCQGVPGRAGPSAWPPTA
jgi:cobalt-zinc-cadmium resistance protein CzcA